MTGEILTMPSLSHPFLTALALLTAVGLTGCPNPRQDVRLSLCQDMVTGQLGAEPTWQGNEIQIRGYEDAVVRLRFTSSAGAGRAECAYKHAKGEDTAITLANPIEAYSTSPTRMTLNGRTLTGPELARAIQQAMGKQGREFLDRTKETLRGQ
jgi:hypothetical protein